MVWCGRGPKYRSLRCGPPHWMMVWCGVGAGLFTVGRCGRAKLLGPRRVLVENALSAALQLQHDAGLVLSNVQVLQQLVTSMCLTASDVLLAVHGRQAFPSRALQQVIPSYRVRRASHYMMAMGLWRPPVETVSPTPMSSVACNACTSCQDCCPRVPRWNEK